MVQSHFAHFQSFLQTPANTGCARHGSSGQQETAERKHPPKRSRHIPHIAVAILRPEKGYKQRERSSLCCPESVFRHQRHVNADTALGRKLCLQTASLLFRVSISVFPEVPELCFLALWGVIPAGCSRHILLHLAMVRLRWKSHGCCWLGAAEHWLWGVLAGTGRLLPAVRLPGRELSPVV